MERICLEEKHKDWGKNRKPILNNCYMGKVDFVLNRK